MLGGLWLSKAQCRAAAEECDLLAVDEDLDVDVALMASAWTPYHQRRPCWLVG